MNEQAIKDSYDLFVANGYGKSIDEYKTLISSNPNALKDSYDIFVSNGYTKSIGEYSTLMGLGGSEEPTVKKKEVSSQPVTTDLRISSNPQAMEAIGNRIDQIDPLSPQNLDFMASSSGRGSSGLRESQANLPQESAPSENIPQGNAPPTKGGIGGEQMARLERASSGLLGGVATAPALAWDVLTAATRTKIAKSLGLEVPRWEDSWGQPANVNIPFLGEKDINPISWLERFKKYSFEHSDEMSKIIKERNPEADKGYTDLISNGQYGAAARNLFGNVVEMVPVAAGFMVGAGELNVATNVGVGAGVFGGEQYNEAVQSKEYGGLNRDGMALVSAVSGGVTGLWMGVAQGVMGSALKKVIANEGANAAKATLNAEWKNTMVDLVMKKPWVAPFMGALDMMGMKVNTNIVDNLSGYKPDTNPWDGVFETGINGLALGGTQGAFMHGVSKAVEVRSREKLPSEKEADAKIKDIADRLVNPDVFPTITAPIEKIQKWANLMRSLGRIEESTETRILDNVYAYNQAKNILDVGKGRGVKQPPKIMTRMIDLITAKDELQSSTERSEFYKDQISSIKKEMSYIADNQALPPEGERYDISHIIDHTRTNVARYIIDGSHVTKKQFDITVSKMTEQDFKDHKIEVSNDKESSNLLTEKSHAIQEPSTTESLLRSEQPQVGLQEVGERNPQEPTKSIEEAKAEIDQKNKEALDNIVEMNTNDGLATYENGSRYSYMAFKHDAEGNNIFHDLWHIEGATKEELRDKINAKYKADKEALKESDFAPRIETTPAVETPAVETPAVETPPVAEKPLEPTHVVSEAGETTVKEVSSKTHEESQRIIDTLSDIESTAKTISELGKDARESKLFDLKNRDSELANKIETEPADNPSVLHAITERESIAKRIESLEVADKIDAIKDKIESAKNAREKAKLEKDNLALHNRFRELNGNFSYSGYELISHTNKDIVKANSYTDLAEKYHAAKADGSNPVLVKSVEDLVYKKAGTSAPETIAHTVAEVVAPEVVSKEEAPKSEKPKEATEVEKIQDDIDYYEMKIEDAQEEKTSSLSDLREDIAALKKKKDDIRSSKLTKSEKTDELESIDAKIEDLKDNYDAVIDDLSASISEHKTELKKLAKKLSKEQAKAITLQQTKANEQPSRTEEASRTNEGAGEGTSKLSRLLETITKKSSVKGGINKRDVRETQRIRGHNVDVVSEITFDNSLTSKIKSVFTKFGGTQKVYEIKNGDSYLELQKKALENNPHKASVTYKTAEDYNGTRMFITEDGSAGLVLTKDGELSAGFSDGTHRNAISQLLILGIKEGAQHIECFDTVLPDIYTKFGFKFKSRTEFNEEFAPEGWDYETYKEFNDGKPDVLFGVYEGGDRNTIEDRIGTFGEYKQEDAKLFDKESYQQAHDYNLNEDIKLNKKEGSFVEPVADEVSRLESMLDEGTQFQLGTEPSKAKEAMIAEAEKLMVEAEDKGLSEKVFDATTPEPQVTQVPIIIKENSKLAAKVKRMGLSELIGKKINLVMADQLKVGTVKAGKKVLNRMGGHFFPLMDKIFGKAAWASMDITAANKIINGAVKADYTVVYNMKPTAIDSNKAISETFLETIKSLPKAESDVILKQIIDHLTGKKFGKNTNRVNDAIANVKTFKEFSDAISSLSVDLKAKILNLIIPSDAVKAATEIGKSLQKLGLSIETIRSINTEQFVSELPMGAMTMVLEVHDKSGNKVTAKTRGEALITREQQIAEGLPTHDNYPIYVRGKAIAILNETVPFWHMLKGSLNTINVKLADIIKNKEGRGFTSKEALSAEMRSAMMSASSAKSTSAPNATHYQKFVSLLSRSFPTVKVVATEAEFKNLTDRLGAQKLLTKNQKVYGAIHDGNLYLNPSLENYNTPIHEFGHIWTNVAKNARPHLYEKGISLIKGSDYESRVLNSADYKRVTDKMRKNGSTEQEISHYLSEEALAMAIGDKGESFVIASHRTAFHDWMNKLYTVVKNLTGISKYTPEQLQNITLEEFTKAIAVDLMSGKELFSKADVSKASQKLQLETAGRSAEDIVKNAREHGFSEESIRTVLEKRGYSSAEVADSMAKVSPTTTLSEAILTGYDSLISKIDAKIRQQVADGIEIPKISKYIDKMLAKSEVYKNATDAHKKSLELECKNKLGVRENRAATSGRFFGAIKDITGISNKDKKSIVRNIRDLSQDSAKHITQELRMLAEVGKVTLSQINNIISKFGKTNLNSETSVSNFVEYMSKVFNDAEYSAKLTDANKMLKSIKKLSKSQEKNANVRALAGEFVKINPSMVEDINLYNSMASKIDESIKGSTIRREKVTFAETVNIAEASEYIRDAIEKQDSKIREQRIAEIQELMGIDVSDLSAEEMLGFLEKDEPITKYNEGIVRSTINKMFNIYSTLIKESFSTGKDVFTQDDVSHTKGEKELVGKFMSMDLKMLSPKNALKAVDALSNFLQNKSTAKMQTVVSEYAGEYNARALERKGVKSTKIKKYWSPNIGRFLVEQTYNLNMVFERMFGGVNSGALVKRVSGVADVINNKAMSQKLSSNITKSYVDKFYKKIVNGEAYNSEYNNVERGMYAFMTRTVIGSEGKMKIEFSRRDTLVKETIEALSKGDSKEKTMAELYQRAYDKIVEGSKNIEEVRAKTSGTNVDGADFWVHEWADKFDHLADVSLNVYNRVLDRDLNYTPDRYSRLSVDSGKVELSNDESAFLNNTDGVIYKKETGVLMAAIKPKNLPKNRFINLSFDTNNSNSMYDALVDVHTASAIRQVEAFFNSDNFSKIVTNGDDAKLLKNRVALYVQNIRKKSPFSNDEMSAVVRNLNKVATIGVGQALGGITQPLKQVIPVGINTVVNAGGLDVLSTFNAAKKSFIDRSGYAIANRGIESQAHVESINKLIDLAANSTGEKAMKLIEKANKKWLEVFLVNPDVYIARMSWMTYYEKALKMDGVDPKSIDYSTHEVNTKAADYAQEMVDRQQNVSDVEMAGKLFSNKEPSSQILVKTLMPFASFRMNQSARLGTDISVLTSKTSTVEDKIIAGRSVAGFGVEMAVFHALGAGISLVLGSVAKVLMGKDETDEEYEKRKANVLRGRGSAAIADMFSPIPVVDKLVQSGASSVLSEAQDFMEIDEKEKVSIYSSTKQEFVQSLGTFGIAIDKANQLYELVTLSTTGKYKDNFGNEKTISEADKEALALFIPPAMMVNMGLAPSEVSSVIRYAVKDAKKEGKTEKQSTSGHGMSKEDMKTYMPKTYERFYGKNSAIKKIEDKAKERTKPFDDKIKAYKAKMKLMGKRSGL